LIGAEISSPGTDLPVNLLLWLIAVLWAEHVEQAQPFHPLLIVILAAFAVTVKLSAVPILLLALFILIGQALQPGRRVLWGSVICAALVILPFLARNLVLSGYLLYPLPLIDIFSFDWKVPLRRVLDDRAAILAWGRFPRMDAVQVLAMPFGEWFPRWLADQTPNRSLMLFAALSSPVAAIPALWAKRLERRIWLAWLVFLAGTIFWLLSAPDFRFGYGFLVGTILLGIAPWLAALLDHLAFQPARVAGLFLVVLLVYLGFVLAISFETRTFADRLLLPADYDHVSTQTCDLANGTISCAKAYNACSYAAFPCVPSPRPNVALRGGSLGDGFRTLP